MSSNQLYAFPFKFTSQTWFDILLLFTFLMTFLISVYLALAVTVIEVNWTPPPSKYQSPQTMNSNKRKGWCFKWRCNDITHDYQYPNLKAWVKYGNFRQKSGKTSLHNYRIYYLEKQSVVNYKSLSPKWDYHYTFTPYCTTCTD